MNVQYPNERKIIDNPEISDTVKVSDYFLKKPGFYFIVLGIFSFTWGVLRGLWELTIFETAMILIIPFFLIIWYQHKLPTDGSPSI